ncbi:MAG: J domain-containing protein [Desulfuromonadia bacterium]
MTIHEESILIDACRTLFGDHLEIGRDFLHYLQPEGIKSAYRTRARECHPDSYLGEGDIVQRTELFRRSVEAYQLLIGFVRRRSLTPPPSTRHDPRPSAPPRRFHPVRELRPRTPGERYYDGPMPPLELKLGLFLYFRGVVSYQTVVRALLWQREMRPSLGELACSWGWMTPDLVDYVISAVQIPGPFGNRALKLGLLDENRLKVLLFHQRSLQKPIGRYFVEERYLDERQLLRLMRERIVHNADVRADRI